MSEAVDTRATIGHNMAPPTLDVMYKTSNEQLPEFLATENTALVSRTDDLVAAFGRAPDSIDSQEMAGKMSDFIAQIGVHIKAAEAKRVDLKAGPLTAGRLIDGFFQKNVLDRLTPAKTTLLKRLTAWEQKVAAEERQRREAEERKRRAEAEEAERLARIAQEQADRERRAAEAAERERLAKIQNEKDLQKAVELEEENRRLNAERDARAKAAAEEADRARAEAERAAKEAAAKASELSTTRGDYGSSSSLRTAWVARIEDMDAIDLNALRAFIPQDAIQKALNAYVRVNKNSRPLKGAVFTQETSAVVRG